MKLAFRRDFVRTIVLLFRHIFIVFKALKPSRDYLLIAIKIRGKFFERDSFFPFTSSMCEFLCDLSCVNERKTNFLPKDIEVNLSCSLQLSCSFGETLYVQDNSKQNLMNIQNYSANINVELKIHYESDINCACKSRFKNSSFTFLGSNNNFFYYKWKCHLMK
jgi:hypothetical protein